MSAAPTLTLHRSMTQALRLFDADRLRWLDEAAANGPLVGLRMGPVTTWVVTDPDMVREMLVADASAWIRPPATLVPMRLGVGENLFTQPEKAWSQLQPAVAPAFRKRALEARLVGMDEIIREEVRGIPHDTTIDLDLTMGCIALSLAAWVLLGERLDRSRAEEIAFHQREVVNWVGVQLGRVSGFLPWALGARAREMKAHRDVLNAYADEVIARAQRSDRADDDVLGALLAARPAGRALAPEELRSHVLGLFLAGNETTAAALSWALVHAVDAPADWERVRNDPDANASNFISETLRLTPAVWGIPRTPSRRGTVLTSGATSARVWRGRPVVAYLRGMNRDAMLWPDPLRFDPARHVHSGPEQHRGLLPFGLGPRGCIGQHLAVAELNAVLPALARHGNVVVDGPVHENPTFALRIRGGLRGRFKAPAD